MSPASRPVSEEPYFEAGSSDDEAQAVERPPDEFVPCPPELYSAHTTSVIREGDHWRCLICQPPKFRCIMVGCPILDRPHEHGDGPAMMKVKGRQLERMESDRERLRRWENMG